MKAKITGSVNCSRSVFISHSTSWVDGIATVLNLGGRSNVRYKHFVSARWADTKAIESDWLAVGDDIRTGIEFCTMKERKRLSVDRKRVSVERTPHLLGQ